MPTHRHLTKIELERIHQEFTSSGKQQTGEYLRLYRKATTGELPIATGEQPTVKRPTIQRPTTQPLARQNVMSSDDIALMQTICMPAFPDPPKQSKPKIFSLSCNLRQVMERGATLDQAVLYFIDGARKQYHRLPDGIRLNFRNIITFVNADLIHEGNLREILFRHIIPVEPAHLLNDDFMLLDYEIAISQQKVG